LVLRASPQRETSQEQRHHDDHRHGEGVRAGKRPEAVGKTILAIVPSFAERYLSTALFEGI
jgi:hypothetical protein